MPAILLHFQQKLQQIRIPALPIVADRDKMLSVDKNRGIYPVLPDTQLAVLPAASNAIERVKCLLVKDLEAR